MTGEHRELHIGRANFLKYAHAGRSACSRKRGIGKHFQDETLGADDVQSFEALRGGFRQQP